MTYSFDSLYQSWVTDIQTNIPSTPCSSLTKKSFLDNMLCEFECYMNEDWDIPDDLVWIINNLDDIVPIINT